MNCVNIGEFFHISNEKKHLIWKYSQFMELYWFWMEIYFGGLRETVRFIGGDVGDWESVKILICE